MHQIVMETDKRSHEMCTSIGKFVDEQSDIRRMVEELARRIDATQDGTHPSDGTHPRKVPPDGDASQEQNLPDVSVAMHLEIEDVKKKVARLT